MKMAKNKKNLLIKSGTAFLGFMSWYSAYYIIISEQIKNDIGNFILIGIFVFIGVLLITYAISQEN